MASHKNPEHNIKDKDLLHKHHKEHQQNIDSDRNIKTNYYNQNIELNNPDYGVDKAKELTFGT